MVERSSFIILLCLLGSVANAARATAPVASSPHAIVAMIFEPGYSGYCALTAAQARAVIPPVIKDAVPKDVELKDQPGPPCAVEMIKNLRVSAAECVVMSPVSAACPVDGHAVLHVRMTY